jgi:imidazoleglycerol-phosphate dehydratase
MAAREARVRRRTRETEVEVALRLDGDGTCAAETGVPFLDHMLAAFSRTALCDLRASCRGDLEVEPHHSVEDVGFVLGQAVAGAVGDRAGLGRYGFALLPMDDALARVALDLSGRAHLVWGCDLPPQLLGTFATALAEEFWLAATRGAAWTLHVDVLRWRNPHHALEAVWKAAGLALRAAAAPDPRIRGPLSTKGVLGAPGGAAP